MSRWGVIAAFSSQLTVRSLFAPKPEIKHQSPHNTESPQAKKWGGWPQCGLSFYRSKLITLKKKSSFCLFPFRPCAPTYTVLTPTHLWHKSAPVRTTLHSCRTAGWRHCVRWASHNLAHTCTAAHRPSQTQRAPADGRWEKTEGLHMARLSETNTVMHVM